jgi:hypothetical protein
MNHKVFHRERSWPCLQILFKSLFSLAELLNMVVVQNFGVILAQISEPLCVEFHNFVQCHILNDLTLNQVAHIYYNTIK